MNFKRKLYVWNTGLFFCLSALFACSDDDTPIAEPIQPQAPTVSITANETGYTTANITLTSTHALQCAYLVIKENATQPDAKEILSKGTKVAVNKSVNILIEDLDANSKYTIVAAVRGEEEKKVTSTDITTKAIPLPEKSHTLIFYYMGDNTGMENELETNLRVIQGAAGHLIRLSEKNNVAVYYDNGKTATLTKLAIDETTDRTKHVKLAEYTQEDLSTDPVIMKGILNKIKEELPADTYGLVLSSHGGGWVPNDIFDSHVLAQTRFIGQDGTDYMEIPDLAEALEGSHFEYILFDACLMSSVEALYDLRHAADYLIASPAEVLAEGFPYKEIVSQLFYNDLKGACQSFMNKYRQTSGTIALVQTDKLEALAAAFKQVLTAADHKQVNLNKIQGYEGLSPHLFFDLEQYAEALASDVNDFKTALQEAVVYKDHTSTFISAYSKNPISLPRSCGLSCYIDSGNFPKTLAAWKETGWAKAIGAAQ